MDKYIQNYDSYTEKIVYDFQLGDGGIGDCIKFFMFLLEICAQNNIKLYYKRNNIDIEKYIQLKHLKMYFDEQRTTLPTVKPQQFYSTFKYNFTIPIKDVFKFTEKVITNRNSLLSPQITNYISIHLRLGDKYLECDKQYVLCKNDTRLFSEETLCSFIEKNYTKQIFFCCDNNAYKSKIKSMYDKIIITACDIGHTSLSNTTEKQVLDAATELYILSQSELLYCASESSFSVVASKFNNIPLYKDPN
jgi:hypothetical protein